MAFGSYSQYYELLYVDKDYRSEAEYVHGLVRTHQPGATSALDLGCGTGTHDRLLTELGLSVTGVERSEEMLQVARRRLAAQGVASAGSAKLEFVRGDIRSIRLGSKFDVVLSLFHVISYQNTNADLLAAFTTAATHLEPGGVFIFDCWYGPAVLRDPPVVRVKRQEDAAVAVTRIAEPHLDPVRNLVDVGYHLFVRDKQTGQVSEHREVHSMRYLFTPELEFMLGQVGFSIELTEEFMSKRVAGLDTWSVLFVARKN